MNDEITVLGGEMSLGGFIQCSCCGGIVCDTDVTGEARALLLSQHDGECDPSKAGAMNAQYVRGLLEDIEEIVPEIVFQRRIDA